MQGGPKYLWGLSMRGKESALHTKPPGCCLHKTCSCVLHFLVHRSQRSEKLHVLVDMRLWGREAGKVWLSLPSLRPCSLGFFPVWDQKCHINIFLSRGFLRFSLFFMKMCGSDFWVRGLQQSPCRAFPIVTVRNVWITGNPLQNALNSKRLIIQFKELKS